MTNTTIRKLREIALERIHKWAKEHNNGWLPISSAPQNGKDVWLGWKPFNGTSVMPRRGHYDTGSKQWVSHWEDRGRRGGHCPIPFTPQPDYWIEGYEPEVPIA